MSKISAVRRTAGHQAGRIGRRVVQTRVGRRLRRPAISVVVPFYNVEEYLAECLDSIQRQTFVDYEVVLVDDGSPDGSRAIAERYAARDPRLRVVTRENGGLGAARNTGIREARGRYLTFVDSDDLLPPHALAVLISSAKRTGSDIVVGSVERFDGRSTWSPAWVSDVHQVPRERVRIEEFLPLLRNLYTWNKLFRRDFWDAQGLWFREGVAYEDQPIITQLFARAGAIDVLTQIVYRYRARDDKSSISQQTATVKDLRDRIAAWEVSREAFRTELSATVYDGWLQTLLDAHFQWYLTSPGTVDDDYWNELVAAVRSLTDGVPSWVWDDVTPHARVLVRLAQLDRREDAQEFVRRGGTKSDEWPSVVREDGVLLELPLYGDPELDDSLFVIRPHRLRIAHAVENLHWIDQPDGGRTCWISGWAYLRKLDLSKYDSEITVQLRNEDTGEIRSFPSTSQPPASYAPPRDDLWCDYSPGRFGVEIPLDDLDAGDEAAVWAVWLRVTTAGFTVERPVTRLVRSGSAGAVPAAPLGGGDRLIADWQYRQPLRLRIDRGNVTASDVALSGRVVTGTLAAADAARVARLAVEGADSVAEATWSPTGGGRAFRLELPGSAAPEVGASTTWQLAAWTKDGRRVEVLPTADTRVEAATGSLVLGTNRNGGLVVREWSRGATADRITVSADGRLTVAGRVFGPGSPRVGVATRNKRTRVFGEQTPTVDGRFEASVVLAHELYRFGQRPLPTGDHDLSLVVSDGDAEPVEVPLLVSAELGSALPLPVRADALEGRIVRGPETVVRVTLQRPLGTGRGRYAQNLLRTQGPTRSGLTRGVLMRSYFGEQATDNGISIQKELARRGSDLPVYWAVQDKSIPVPDGGIPVVVNSPEWYDLIFSVKYYVDNMYQPEYHRKADGQVLVQTFHGYPFKMMGHPHWRNLQFSQARIDAYDARARDWDYLVSPARYATPLLVRDFNYQGEVLEIGYPRNDVLSSPEADDIRRQTRESLGIEEGQKAVLYAPTFRDYLASNDTKAVMADFFDFEAAARRLGDEYVLLVRGHAFNARSSQRVGSRRGCIDVTDYPEVSDLYLAADAGIVDYSSLRFDFGVTGKPMIFHVPDLQRYKDTRGWLFDFEPTAPGPLVDTTDEVVDRLLDLDGVREEYAAAYTRFRDDYLDLEDGRAGERFVDAVFVPRGDA
ncbi:bifunctional glycosyltransferase/CDP-glycerol:glycerophosphate glycerophosphotransferase [Nocardioides sp. MAHUQ-72]|uniref:bifunctional glycosyltransferase/CDP-glycerol:glycerophosphate glycerophosphotransferase n=1 Tax=unclassified Nocardioides TaxID=2615069 RepID=UPI0036199FE2